MSPDLESSVMPLYQHPKALLVLWCAYHMQVSFEVTVPQPGLEPRPTDSKSVVLANYTTGEEEHERRIYPSCAPL